MAEIVVSALLSVVFEKLASAALTNVVGRSKKIQSDLEQSKRSLLLIKDLLNDASKKEIKKEGVKEWLNSLQHLAYDMDDILDSLTTDDLAEEEEEAPGNILTKVKKRISSSTTKMHGELKKVNIELQKLYNEKNLLGLEESQETVGRSLDKNRNYQGPISPGRITGREGEKQILVQQLLADHEPCDQNNFRVVPIVGMGGVGKTTLARLLYNEPKVVEHFDLKAWVCVSDEEFDSFKISKLIFESVAKEHKKSQNTSALQEELKGQLSGKRFLLVLDDVWTESIENWETLMPAFLAVAPGSKIIITTRKTTLIQHLKYGNPNCNPFHLNKLSDKDSLSLFAHYALNANNFESHPTLKPHGEAIMRKCDGLPLALKTLGRLLSTKAHEDDWKQVSESEIWGLKDADGVLPALRLSYFELSPCLKQLFAYTCLFPKDYVFEKEDLIWLWMAEGFLHEERLGEEYFDELLSRSFFECMDNDASLFVMHDLMNDLATSVAGEFFVRLDIEMKRKIKDHSLIRHMSFVREEFMHCTKFKAFEMAKRLRTFLAVPIVVNRWERFHLSNKIMIELLPQLPLLRVLCLSRLGMHEVPEFVGKLEHLRYLNLSENPIKDLPNNTCNLYNLQTLIVSGCDNLSKLPNNFLKLRNLRHFDIRRTKLLCNMPLGIGELENLQILSDVIVGENEFGFKFLKNLRRSVSIRGLDKLQTADQAREANLSRMRLSELSLTWSDVFDGSRNEVVEKDVLDVLQPPSYNLKELTIRSYGGLQFSKWVGDSSFNQLTDVTIEQCKKCKFLPPLGLLPLLKKLSIASMDGVEKVGPELLGTTGLKAFPSLESLYFGDMVGWEGWSTNSGVPVFPCLQRLRICNCPNLVEVSLEAIPSLRDLEVKECGGGVLTSLVRVASSITKLSIDLISGLTDEVWGGLVQHIAAVENLSIRNCHIIRHLCGCKFLVNLKKLRISCCDELVRIGGGEKGEEEGSILTSLRMLFILGCNNLEHLSCPNNIEEMRIVSCRSITSVTVPTGGWEKLKSLRIERCSSELEKELEKMLTINNTNVPPMLEVVYIDFVNLKSITKLNCFIQLRHLVIKNCPVIESFPELQNLNLLKSLDISYCERMEGPPLRSGGGSGSVSVGVWPPNLYSLMIGELKRPISEWGPLPTSLVELTLLGGSSAGEEEDVTCFPTSLLIPSSSSSSSSLTRLGLYFFEKMERISEGLQHLTSLQHLSILGCPKLKDLPETLLPELLSLSISLRGNKKLKKKTSRGGYYWHLLSDIPEVRIYN